MSALFSQSIDLIEGGSKASEPSNADDALWEHCQNGKWSEVKTAIDSEPASLQKRDGTGNYIIHWMCLHGNFAAVKELLERGQSAISPNSEGQPPMHFAVMSDSDEIVDVLARHGASTSAQDHFGGCPVTVAGRTGAKLCILRLLQLGADPWQSDYQGVQLPHWAAIAGQVEALRVWHSLGLSLEHPDGQGYTPLHRAVLMQQPGAVDFILRVTEGRASALYTAGGLLHPLRVNASGGDPSTAEPVAPAQAGGASGTGAVIETADESSVNTSDLLSDQDLQMELQQSLDRRQEKHLRDQAIAARKDFTFTTTTQGEGAAVMARRIYTTDFDKAYEHASVELAQHKQVLRTQRAIAMAGVLQGDDTGNDGDSSNGDSDAPLMTEEQEARFRDRIIKQETKRSFAIGKALNTHFQLVSSSGLCGQLQRAAWWALGNGRLNLWLMTAWFYLTWFLCTWCFTARLEPVLREAAGARVGAGGGGSGAVEQSAVLGGAEDGPPAGAGSLEAFILLHALPWLAGASFVLYTIVFSMPAGEVEWHEDIVEATPERIEAAKKSGLVANPELVGRDGVIWQELLPSHEPFPNGVLCPAEARAQPNGIARIGTRSLRLGIQAAFWRLGQTFVRLPSAILGVLQCKPHAPATPPGAAAERALERVAERATEELRRMKEQDGHGYRPEQQGPQGPVVDRGSAGASESKSGEPGSSDESKSTNTKPGALITPSITGSARAVGAGLSLTLFEASDDRENAERGCVASSAVLGLDPAFKKAVLCPTSLKLKPMRSKFDSISGKVYRRFDHWCPWVGNAVGENNYVFFLMFCVVQPFVALAFALGARYVYVKNWNECTGIVSCVGALTWQDLWLNYCTLSLLFSMLFGAVMVYAVISQSAYNITTNEGSGLNKYAHFWKLELEGDDASAGSAASGGSTTARGAAGHSHGDGEPCCDHDHNGRGAAASGAGADDPADDMESGLLRSSGAGQTTRLTFVRRFDNPFSLGSPLLNVLGSLGLYPQRRVTFADVHSLRTRQHHTLARRIATMLARSALASLQVTSAGAGHGAMEKAAGLARQMEPPPALVDTMMGPASRKVEEAAQKILELPATGLPVFARRGGRRRGGLRVFLDLAEGFGDAANEGQGGSSARDGAASAVASAASRPDDSGAAAAAAMLGTGARSRASSSGGGKGGGATGGAARAAVAETPTKQPVGGDAQPAGEEVAFDAAGGALGGMEMAGQARSRGARNTASNGSRG